MNNRAEARARQNRSTALILTILVYVIIVAGIVYGNMGAKSEKVTAKAAVEYPVKP